MRAYRTMALSSMENSVGRSASQQKKMADASLPVQALPREYGSKQVLIVHKGHGRLKDNIQAILGWQNDFFGKDVNSGVSYCMCSVDELAKIKDALLNRRAQKILIVEKDIFEKSISVSPNLHSSSLSVVLGADVDLSNNAGGLLNVMCSLFGIPHGAPVTPVVLMRLVSAVSGYAPLFFPEDDGLYVYQSGAVEDPIPEIIRNRLQEKGTGEVVVISAREISRLNDIDSRHCLVMVRTSALRRSMDIFDLPTEDFVRTVFQRGLDVRVMKLGDL